MTRATVFGLMILALMSNAIAARVPYRFVSLDSAAVTTEQFDSLMAINRAGVIARATGRQIFVIAGLVETLVATAPTDAVFESIDINERGEIAVLLRAGGNTYLRRYDDSGTWQDMATGGTGGDYASISRGIFINESGQISATVVMDNGDTTSEAIYRFSGDDAIEIARTDPGNSTGFQSLSTGSLNDHGVVAFRARRVGAQDEGVYTSAGGPILLQGMLPLQTGSNATVPVINNNGLIVSSGQASGLFLVQDGAVNTVVPVGASGIFSSLSAPTVDDRGNVAFIGGTSATGPDWGLFTGGDEDDDVVIRTSEPMFGGVVSPGVSPTVHMTSNAASGNGEIAITVQLNGPVSHAVRAISLDAGYDSDDDLVSNAKDNCLIRSNGAQSDFDGDGFGNACDPDFNNDNVVNFSDLSFMKSVFFSNNPNADLTGDGIVNFADLAVMTAMFFRRPGPSALVE